MRLFVALFLVDMMVRAFVSLTPYEEKWSFELQVYTYPPAIAAHGRGWAERASTLSGVARFLLPWPEPRTRERIHGAGDIGRFAVTWVATRLNFFGTLVGVDQRWNMFSPNASERITVPRFRLVYRDGSERIVRSDGEPADLLRFHRWLGARQAQAQLTVLHRPDAQRSVARWLSHRYPRDARGSELARIELFAVRYRLPAPGEDARAVLAAQAGPPPSQVGPTFAIYDPATDGILPPGRSRP